MKIAVLILCHKNPEQINLMLDAMKHPAFTFFILIDKKSAIKDKIRLRSDIIVLPDDQRICIQWGKISKVDASLTLFKFASLHGNFDFYWFCSGQDFPIKRVGDIISWFDNHSNNDFIDVISSKNYGLSRENNFDKRNAIYFPLWLLGNRFLQRVFKRLYIELTGGYNHTFKWARRIPLENMPFYFGSEWVCLSNQTLNWMFEYLDKNSDYYTYMRNCSCPDESFYQTLFMNSPYANKRLDYLHYIDWSEGKSSPKTLKTEDMDKLLKSSKLMARKFDIETDRNILMMLQNYIST